MSDLTNKVSCDFDKIADYLIKLALMIMNSTTVSISLFLDKSEVNCNSIKLITH